jgi:putative selenate reductase
MSDIMRPLPINDLIGSMLRGRHAEGAVFGVSRPFVKENNKSLSLFGEKLELPFGPAAGPHTQLAQNIIAAYYAGGRFFELKTVQTLDGADLPVEKPCIYVPDEGYNVEWSTELRVEEAFEEYVKAWFVIKLLAKEYNLGDPGGFIFNMSVGYDFEGISSPKIDRFIEGLKDASRTAVWQACKDAALASLDCFEQVDAAYIESISPRICRSITLSTLHGCPPQEIERIARYLLEEKGLHTFVKCNPTLLGYEYARQTLDRLGYSYLQFDDHHFREDLQYEQAIPMIKRLLAVAAQKGLTFGVKLTNTFPVEIANQELPGTEMYMSGRALFPLSLQLAHRLSRDFAGQLPISFSGGADYWNIKKLYEAGIWPVTLATSLLKPGGYQRLTQLAALLDASVTDASAVVDAAVLNTSALAASTDSVLVSEDRAPVKLAALAGMAEAVLQDKKYHKPCKTHKIAKIKRQLPILNCFLAPCQEACPIGQDIPAYVSLVTEQRYAEALTVILDKNPLPFMTGTLCHHRCTLLCTRKDYEESVRIREAKLAAAEKGYSELMKDGLGAIRKLSQSPDNSGAGSSAGSSAGSTNKARAAVVGGGPAGLAAAYFLSRAGLKVTLFEKKASLGGIVRQIIPDFRISAQAIDRDIEIVKAMGVDVQCNTEIKSIETLKEQGFSHVILAVGAWQPGQLTLEKGQAMPVFEFLKQFKENPDQLSLGQHVVIVGGGNTAMDAARAALRVAGVSQVALVYRRTRQYMPADEAELEAALAEGVILYELLQPIALDQGHLHCVKMELGAADASGRRSPIATGEKVIVAADTVISAVGEKIDQAFYQANGIELDEKGRPMVEPETGQTNVANVYIAGDGLKGPASIVEAIADARLAADAVLAREGMAGQKTRQGASREAGHEAGHDAKGGEYNKDGLQLNYSETQIRNKKGWLQPSRSPQAEGERCLTCSVICENCVDVCPNRANAAIKVPGMGMTQIVHLDRLCNECGNCAAFCPYEQAPYKSKLTVFAQEIDFINSTNEGFFMLDHDAWQIRLRLGGKIETVSLKDRQAALETLKDPALVDFVEAILRDYEDII